LKGEDFCPERLVRRKSRGRQRRKEQNERMEGIGKRNKEQEEKEEGGAVEEEGEE
jgi:hypothetical protein